MFGVTAMSGFARRVGRRFQILKKTANRQDYKHASSITTVKGICLKQRTSVGPGIVAMAPFFSNVMYRMYTNQNADTHDNVIVDLEKLVKTEAWKHYRLHKGRLFYCFGRQPFEMKIDWSDVNFISDTPTFQRIEDTNTKMTIAKNNKLKNIQDVHHVDVYCNNTSVHQSRTIKSEIEVASSCLTSVKKGYRLDGKVGMSLAVPGDIAQVSAEFAGGLMLQNDVDNSDLKTHTQTTEDIIKIPSYSEITISRRYGDITREFDFDTLVTIKGEVRGCFYNKSRDIIYIAKIPMEQILVKMPSHLIEKKHGSHKVHYKGTCSFKLSNRANITIQETKKE